MTFIIFDWFDSNSDSHRGMDYFTPAKIASIRSAASFFNAGRMCTYKSVVMEIRAWPKISDTTFNSTP